MKNENISKGFNRCGTSSIFHFFKKECEPKLKCLHWEGGNLAFGMFENMKCGRPLLEGKYEKHDVYTDMQVFIQTKENTRLFLAHVECYKILDEQYPGSRFILNTRDVDKWVKSRLQHYSSDCMIKLLQGIYKTNNLEDAWKKQWRDHHEDVLGYFKKRNDLLVFDIEKDKGEKIAKFFPELSFKNTVFPRVNKSTRK